MAYNPSLYNPYGLQMNTVPMQPAMNQVNGLVRVESYEGARMFQLPPNSVSPPLFLGSDNVFFIKTTDGGGAATIKRYRFEEEPDPVSADLGDKDYVTRDDLDTFKTELLEAIHGQHTVSGQPSQQGAAGQFNTGYDQQP